MSLAPVSFSLRALNSVGFCLAMMFAPLANAIVTFDFSVTPASIVAGGSAVLNLHTDGQTTFPARFILSTNLTFDSGDGQTFHLASSIPPLLVNDFQHTFVYLSSGIFLPSISGSVSGLQADAAALNPFSQDVDLSARLEVTAAAASVPEPGSTAMLVAGLAVLAASRGRKKADRSN